MNYIKSFSDFNKVNENTAGITTNAAGVVQISKLEQYQEIPELVKALTYFENTNGIAIGPNSTGAENIVRLIVAQLKMNGIEIADTNGEYTDAVINAIRDFQTKKGLAPSGMVDHSTYNVLFGGKPLTAASTQPSGENIVGATKYDELVARIIDALEGGYYHPNMMRRDPAKFKDYSKSGETMFGLDRHAGHSLYYSTQRPQGREDVFVNLPHIESGEYEYKSEEAKEFWTTIDTADAKNKWSWGYRGGTLEGKLRQLAGKIMEPKFNELFKQYVNPTAQQIIKEDDRLLFHFIYATWNGQGWFKKFAQAINSAVEQGITNPDELYKVAINSRLNSQNGLIKGSGEKILKLYPITNTKSADSQFLM
jgi:hypothetical protein